MVELTNDGTLECMSCGEVIKAYTSGGETNFCPTCGSRELEEFDGEAE